MGDNLRSAVVFGDVLRELLEAHLGHRKAKVLAEQIGVDASLIRRWLRCERVPGLDSNYLDWIADALNLTPAERERLQQAQIETLKVPTKTIKKHRRPPPAEVLELLADEMGVLDAHTWTVADAGTLQDVYTDEGAFLRAFDAAVQCLAPVSDDTRHEILIAMPVPPDSRNSDDDLTSLWTNSLLMLLQKGWNYSLISSRQRGVPMRDLVLRLVQVASTGPGSFVSYSLQPEAAASGLTHLAVFPDVALIGLASKPDRPADSTLVQKHRPHVTLLRRHFDYLRQHAEPAITLYGPRDYDLIEDIAALEQLPGDHMLVKDGFNVLVAPPDWFDTDRLWTGEAPISLEEFDNIVRVNRQRQAHFYEALQQFRWKDVSSQRAILEVADTGRIRNPDLVQQITLSPPERIACLRHLIRLLEDFKNYQLALASDDEAHVFAPAMWMVHGTQGVLLRRRASNGRFNSVVARDVGIARGFRQYFTSEIWNSIKPRHRDKEWVAHFIWQAIERVEAFEADSR